MKKCYFCDGTLTNGKDRMERKGKHIHIDVENCNKCGESFSNLAECERARKYLHPTLLERIKGFLE